MTPDSLPHTAPFFKTPKTRRVSPQHKACETTHGKVKACQTTQAALPRQATQATLPLPPSLPPSFYSPAPAISLSMVENLDFYSLLFNLS